MDTSSICKFYEREDCVFGFEYIQDKTRLLVCLKNGFVYEYEGPGGIKFDTSTSYLIETQLPVRIFRFRSIKSRLRVREIVVFIVKMFVFQHEEELERKRIEEEERQKKLEEERRLRGIEKKEKGKYSIHR